MNLVRKLFLYILIVNFFFCFPLYGETDSIIKRLKVGDIIFQDIDNSKLAEAIEKVAPGYDNRPISHVAMVYEIKNEKIKIIEAYGGVRLISIKEFLNRSLDKAGNPKIIIGRVKSRFISSIKSAVDNCKEYIGKPYDSEFLIDNDKYYCSELIYEIFKEKKRKIFQLKPMNYICENEPSITEFWKFYFNTLLKTEIPQGKPGITPGDLSLSNKIQIIYLPKKN